VWTDRRQETQTGLPPYVATPLAEAPAAPFPPEAASAAAADGVLETVWRILRRQWLVVVCSIGIAAALAAGLSSRQEKRYTAAASLLFGTGSDTGLPTDTKQVDPARVAATNQSLLGLDVIAQNAAARLGNRVSPEQIAAYISIASKPDADVVEVQANTSDPRLSAEVANAYASGFIDFRKRSVRKQIEEALAQAKTGRAAMTPEQRSGPAGAALGVRIDELETAKTLQSGGAELVQVASPPTSPSSPRPKRAGILGGILGALLGFALASVRTRSDSVVRTVEELEVAAGALLGGAPVLAEIPTDRRLTSRPMPDWIPGEDTPEGFRLLRTTLRYFRREGQSSMTILVASAAPGEGKTMTSWNLAVAAASDGDAVLLVEADLRRPRILPAAMRTDAGLAPLLAGLMSFKEAVMSTTVAAPVEDGPDGRLDVLPAGEIPPNPLQLLQSERMHELLNYVGGRYDLVVIDSPAVTAVADALALVREVDGVVVVTRLGVTTRGQIQELGRSLQNIGASVLGIVVNGAKERGPNYYKDPGG
jgi:polysaccharide biosynthesis transport protein